MRLPLYSTVKLEKGLFYKFQLLGHSYFTQQLAWRVSLHLAKVWDGETKSAAVSGASIHVIPNKEYDLQQLRESFTFPELLAGCGHRHHIWLYVVQLLLKLQLELDGLKPRHQSLHTWYLDKQKRWKIWGQIPVMDVATPSVCADVHRHLLLGHPQMNKADSSQRYTLKHFLFYTRWLAQSFFFWFISEYQTTMKSRNIWQLIIKTVLSMDYFESLLKPIIFMQLGLIP